MNPKNPDARSVRKRNLSPEPESMQKYSDEVRKRIARKARELYEQRGRQAERDMKDWLKAEELVRNEMTDRRATPLLPESRVGRRLLISCARSTRALEDQPGYL